MFWFELGWRRLKIKNILQERITKSIKVIYFSFQINQLSIRFFTFFKQNILDKWLHSLVIKIQDVLLLFKICLKIKMLEIAFLLKSDSHKDSLFWELL